MDRFFIVTGGSGSGKTTLLDALARHGIATMAEAGRAIIQQQMAAGGSALPWADREAFAEKMLAFDVTSYETAKGQFGPILFDRGIPDVIGYRTLCGLSIPHDLERTASAHRYNNDVFIAPPWADIYAQDAERKQDWSEALATHEVMARVYSDLGYNLVPLPLTTPDERADFVLRRISANASA
ncbi:putative ATPase [Sphingobium sp. B11D3B]|uniref:AAA family ATPase n=1 Tax=unclassified Sphingobium TaxID=2611147 RepID=UPI002225151C|nr:MULTISPECIES: AAA family ATPase [unclassified Sphingobium]MCW2350489.1 putative ATPase [Sphingobium sp. B12D2B]MCW2388101.1 putative ATPase [Sphingobium sp. B11D3B]